MQLPCVAVHWHLLHARVIDTQGAKPAQLHMMCVLTHVFGKEGQKGSTAPQDVCARACCLQVHGSGANRLPTIHIQDLAAFCEALVLQQQSQLQEAQAQAALTLPGRAPQQQPQRQQGRYLLAADAAPVTQQQLVAAVGQLLVHSHLR